MTSYGDFFEFRVAPQPNHRSGRYKNGATAIPIGAPVAVAAASTRDANGRLTFALATAAVAPRSGQHGVAVYEHAFEAMEGKDPFLTTTSDLIDVPVGAPCQLVSGEDVVVVLYNRPVRTVLGRSYPKRFMVAGLSLATPTLAVGDFLGPGAGNDNDGYWAETTAANGWLQIITIDTTRGFVEARFQY